MSEKKKILYLFDVDGTLTKARQAMEPEMKTVINALKRRVHVGLVSGSNIPKVVEQVHGVCGSITDIADYDFIFAENGLDAYRRGENIATQNIANHCGEKMLQDLINFGLKYMSEIQLPKKRGTFVEFRNGMLNFSPIGRSCSQSEREEFIAFDEEHGIRKKFIDALTERFPPNVGLEFAIGEFLEMTFCRFITLNPSGQISVDIYPTGWNKTYCLRFLEGEDFESIHFFGDKVLEGGNDHALYVHPSTSGHAVKDPQDTIRLLLEMVPELRSDVE